MQAIIAVIIALGAMALSNGRADAGSWCATYRWAAQIAAIPPPISAGPPCAAAADFAGLTHSPAPATARPPAAGMAPTLPDAPDVPISETA